MSASVAASSIIAGCSGELSDDSPGDTVSDPSTATPTGTVTSTSTEAELKSRISELEQRVEELKSTRNTKEEKITSLKQELESAKNTKEEEIASLEQELESARDTKEEEIASLEQELESLRSKVDNKNSNIEELQVEVEQKEQRIETLESQVDQNPEFSSEVRSQARTLAKTVRQAVVTIRGRGGESGTAWFIDDDTLVTNSHVVGEQTSFNCHTIDGESFSPTLAGQSDYENQPYHDVAVLNTDFSPQTTLSLGSSASLNTDQPVLQVGHPYSVGNWVVSLGRYVEEHYNDSILTSVPSASGNSGSPLVNLDGDVVGLTTGGVSADDSEVSNPPEAVPLEVKEEFNTKTYATHDTSSVIEQYVTEFR